MSNPNRRYTALIAGISASGGKNMDENLDARREALSPQEEKAKAAILAKCDKLAGVGVTFVAVHFDGYGDDGATEDVKCFDSDYHAYRDTSRSTMTPRACRNTSNPWFLLATRMIVWASEM